MVIGDIVYDLLVEFREPLAAGADTRARMAGRPGGAGANQSVWLARCGVDARFVGRIGRDILGEFLAARLRHDGVSVYLATDDALPTGKIVILVDASGERTMITDRGANLNLRESDLPGHLFQAGRHLHLSGYSYFEDGPRTVALAALKRARAAGMTVSVDPASASLLRDVGPARFLEWTRGAELCFPNLDEGRLLSAAVDPEAIVAALVLHYGAVVLKLGAGGAIFGQAGQTPLHLPAAPAQVVDTTGAGDALCAGFLAAWLGGQAPAPALRQGLALSARAVEHLGGR